LLDTVTRTLEASVGSIAASVSTSAGQMEAAAQVLAKNAEEATDHAVLATAPTAADSLS